MTDRADDWVSDRLLAEYRATLSPWLFARPIDEAPLGIHWCLAPPLADTGTLGRDGHPPRRHAVSEQDYPRRMWVGGTIDFVSPMRVGQRVTRTTMLAPLAFKDGRSGRWCLTGADHRFEAEDQLLLREHQDIAFRPAEAGVSVQAPPATPFPGGDLVWEVATSSTLLFRYSSLTFNGHRIHYDHPFATEVEGYEGLLVHGPLQATILLNLAATVLDKVPTHFAYRASAPLVAGGHMIAVARRDNDGLVATMHAPNGVETMRATAR